MPCTGAADLVDGALPKDTDFVADTASAPQHLLFPIYLFIENFIFGYCIYTIRSLLLSVPPMFVSSHSFSNSWFLILYTCDTHICAHTSTPTPLPHSCVFIGLEMQPTEIILVLLRSLILPLSATSACLFLLF